MNNNNLVSLRRFRAKRLYDIYFALPSTQRTGERAANLIEAILEYAYENVPRHRRARSGQLYVSPGESKRISLRLEEFLFPHNESDPHSLMNWLHANMIPEAWTYPDDLRGFVQDCLRDG
jgi:hypothetical protein